ncbi:MAG: OmpA family protein [Nitrospiraceae bacterium]
MKKHVQVVGQVLLVGLLASAQAPGAWASDYVTDPAVQGAVRGDQRYAFPAGYIRMNQPFSGVVNQVTGDNQLTGNRMISAGTHSVYLRLNNPAEAKLGDLYTVYRRYHKVYHPVTRQYLGELIHQLGVVRITQVEGALAVGKVVASANPIGPGDHLMPFVPQDVTAAAPKQTAQATGEVEGMVVDFLANLTLTAQHQIVYLDRGQDDGLQAGDVMTLYRVGGGLPRRTLGEARIVAVEAHTATAMIAKTISPVLIGDRVTTVKVAAPAVAMDQPEAPTAQVPVTEPIVSKAAAKNIDRFVREAPAPVTMHADAATNNVVVSLNELMDHLYFESGDASVRGEGQELLKHIGTLLKSMPEKPIRIEGHADAQEIGPSLRSKYPTNRELSKARAVGVAEFLAREAGLGQERVTTVGYGSSKPVATNATDEGRQKNRRVEIVFPGDVLSDAAKKPSVKPADQAPLPLPSDANAAPAEYTEQNLPKVTGGSATLSTVGSGSGDVGSVDAGSGSGMPSGGDVPSAGGNVGGQSEGGASEAPDTKGQQALPGA